MKITLQVSPEISNLIKDISLALNQIVIQNQIENDMIYDSVGQDKLESNLTKAAINASTSFEGEEAFTEKEEKMYRDNIQGIRELAEKMVKAGTLGKLKSLLQIKYKVNYVEALSKEDIKRLFKDLKRLVYEDCSVSDLNKEKSSKKMTPETIKTYISMLPKKYTESQVKIES